MASPPKSLDELGRADIQRIAIGTPESVPAGRYAKAALDAAGQWQRLSQRLVNTQNVRQALDYVARGEVDAGFVYATDAQLLSARVRVAFEVPTAEPIVYPIAVIKGGGNERLGQTFVAYVRGDEARAILRKYGFDPL
jgi:molybdate transport system substrate-binding protein